MLGDFYVGLRKIREAKEVYKKLGKSSSHKAK